MNCFKAINGLNEELYKQSNIKCLHVHLPLRYTEAKALHLTCLKTRLPAST